MIFHHIQFLYSTILPFADRPDTSFDVLRYSTFKYSKSILGAPYYVIAALVDHVRLFFPFRHVSILFAFRLTA